MNKFYHLIQKQPIYLLLFLLFPILLFYFYSSHSSTFFFSYPPIQTSLLNIYYINLTQSTDRNQKMIQQCHNLPCTRISAVQGKHIDKNKLSPILKKPTMRHNTIACFLSHIECLERFLQTKDNYAIIMEDDVKFSSHLFQQLDSILQENQQLPIDILFLGGTHVCGKKISTSLLKPIQQNKNCNAGAFAYLISRKGAHSILQSFSKHGIFDMYDHQIRTLFPSMHVYYTYPALVQHDFYMESVRLEQNYKEDYVKIAQSVTIVN